jgi:hypothetical protein
MPRLEPVAGKVVKERYHAPMPRRNGLDAWTEGRDSDAGAGEYQTSQPQAGNANYWAFGLTLTSFSSCFSAKQVPWLCSSSTMILCFWSEPLG